MLATGLPMAWPERFGRQLSLFHQLSESSIMALWRMVGFGVAQCGVIVHHN
jgi:hypothetical protein